MTDIFNKIRKTKEYSINNSCMPDEGISAIDDEGTASVISHCDSVYEEGTESQDTILQRQLDALEQFGFCRPEDPEDDPTGKMCYIAACKWLEGRKDAIVSLPVETVVEKLEQTNVCLDHAGLGDRGTQALSEALKINQVITSLSLADNFITPIGADYLVSSLYVNRTISVLDLSDNELGRHVSVSPGGGIGPILKQLLSRNSNLVELSLRGNKISDFDTEFIAEGMIENHSLQKLDLSYNNIHLRGGVAIAKMLQQNTDLMDLNLSWNQLSASGCFVVLNDGLINSNTMKHFSLSWNGMDDSGGALLGRIIRETSIEDIDVSHNRLGPATAVAIASGINDASTLLSLNLDNNPLQDTGCATIIGSLRDNTSVQRVRLLHTGFGKTAVREASELLRHRHSLEIIAPEMLALM